MNKNNDFIYDYYNKSCYKVDKIEPNKTYYKSIHDLLFESLDELCAFYSDIDECNIKDYESFQNYLIETYYEGEETMNEIFKDIKGYEGLYQISNLGNVKRIKKENYILCKPSKDSHGYKQIVLTKDKKRKSFKIHRLVAQAFIENPNNLPEINHKNEIKENCYVSNLEWCNHIYNSRYGTRGYRCSKHLFKKVCQIDMITKEIIKTYDSMKDAEKETNIKYQGISKCCRKKQKSAGGYLWKYC